MNFSKLNPIALIDENAILTHTGDISVAFKIDLPEINTVSIEDYNKLHGALANVLLTLPENTLIHRQDIFLKKRFNDTLFSGDDDFFIKTLNEHFSGREYLSQTSYLYITLIDGFGFKRNISNHKLFKKITNVENFEKRVNDFSLTCFKALSILTDAFEIRPLKKNELIELIDSHFNGYEGNKVSSPIFKPKFTIGKKHFSIYSLDQDVNQKDGDVSLARYIDKFSTELSSMYNSYMSELGSNFEHEHTLNSFIFYDNQAAVKKNLESQQQKLSGVSMMGRINKINADRINSFLDSVENENLKIVRTHFNVTLFDTDETSLLNNERELQSSFAKIGIVPTENTYLDYSYLFLSNTPGCGGYLPSDYTFYSYLDLALVYTLFDGNTINNSNKGYYYTNRTTNVPFKIDTFFKPYESKLIDNRNYFVIAPSGGGKSFSSKSRLFQQYKMGFDQVVINIGGDDKLVKLINHNSNDALYVEYKDGDSLPINPFYVEEFITNDKIEFLIHFIYLLWGVSDDITSDQHSILNKILLDYYNIDLENKNNKNGYSVSKGNYSIQEFYNYLKGNKDKISIFFNNDAKMFNIDSLLINLEKFAIGNYRSLFESGKPEIYEVKKYIEFELDNIKDHAFLFPIFAMVISDITFNTMWKTGGFKDFFIDEAWKILEKKGMAVLLKYLYKTIRKFDGSVGIAVQQITDIPEDNIGSAILGNCSIKYLLNHNTVLNQIPELKNRLSLKEKDIAMLLSIKNKLKPAFLNDTVFYSEQLLVMGSDYSKIVRVEVSPELGVLFDSDKIKTRRFNEIYNEHNSDLIKSIKNYLN